MTRTRRGKPSKPTRRKSTSRRVDLVSRYARDVRDGKIVAGPHVRNACRRHLRDLRNRKRTGLIWDRDAALRAIEFFPDVLRLSGGKFRGKAFDLEPWQAFCVGSVFGWKLPDGLRRFRRAYIETGKGNGKSPLAAGVGLYMLAADGELDAEIYSAATKKDQALVLFRDAVSMVKQSPALKSRLDFSGGEGNESNIAYHATSSWFRPLSNDDAKSGPRPYAALIDELHEHKNRSAVEMLEAGFKFRDQPLLWMITNSGSDRTGVCWEEHQHGVKVAAGEIEDDEAFAYICAVDEDDDPLEDPSCWPKANPSLGITITPKWLAARVKQAKAIPGRRNTILRLHFCVWTDAESAWISRSAWEACEDPTLQLADFKGERAFAGLDLSSTKDLTALAIVFREGFVEVEKPDGSKKLLPRLAAFVEAWTPGDTIRERAEADQAPYDVWHEQGYLHAPPGQKIRLDHVAYRVVEIADLVEFELVAYDRWLITKFEDELDELGAELPLADHGQGYSKRKDSSLWMPQSIEDLEDSVLDRRLRVQVNPVLRWNIMSAAFEESPASLKRFTKQKSRGRIDGAVALAMAVGAAVATPPDDHGSVYDEPGFLM